MARVVVVGGGFGGMASAARLAKLGHEVTLLELAPSLGGALTSVEAEGYRWDAAASYTLLPAVIRDLFRKSGRPLEKELALVALPVIREHRFGDDSQRAAPRRLARRTAAGLRRAGGRAGPAVVRLRRVVRR